MLQNTVISKEALRLCALSHSLFPATSLSNAVAKMQFVQIDPIRSPAPAQDLILRQRVTDYHVGDIDKNYKELELEEDFLYAHGYMTRDVWNLLQPRAKTELNAFDEEVWRLVKNWTEIRLQELDTYFGTSRETNWWGGYSRSSRMAIERLHYYGFLRVSRREKGQRIYQPIDALQNSDSIENRLREIILIMVHIMAPVSLKTLSQSLHRIHRHFGPTRDILKNLVSEGLLQQESIDGVIYIWPVNVPFLQEAPTLVRFLAPFDPVVRDRIRFEHLWGWLYQFEAYVPSAKRIRGYYAMPLLWKSLMIGWVNGQRINGGVSLSFGFTESRPQGKEFKNAMEEEIIRFENFLGLKVISIK